MCCTLRVDTFARRKKLKSFDINFRVVVFRTNFAEKIFAYWKKGLQKNFREWQDRREKKFDTFF